MVANIRCSSLAPYERRVIELLRNSKDKRARKLAKKRVCFPVALLQLFPSTTMDANYTFSARNLLPRQGQGRGDAARHRRVPPCRSLNGVCLREREEMIWRTEIWNGRWGN
jgi:hypothetical protein